MINNLLTLLFGSKQERDLKEMLPVLHEINSLEAWALSLSEQQIKAKIEEFKEQVAKSGNLNAVLPETFAMAREAARRVLGERPYDVQILGSLVLHSGKIVEMKTGEGKTLSSVAAAALNALTGKGVHIVTVNDYLAERDSKWMGPVYNYLGLSVGVILSSMDPERKKEEYSKDITFGTNNELGFDYLRDNMHYRVEGRVQRGHNFSIIDEIDSILIDEARTPLIISGAVSEDTKKYSEVNQLIASLKECKKDPKTGDYPQLDPFSKEQLEGDFKLDEKGKRVLFTDEGVNHIEELLKKRNLISGSLYEEDNFEYIHYCTQALKAHKLFHRDVDYVVQEGGVQIVDEFTGRILQGRRYSDGLHQAIEAKERIKIAQRNRTLATITFQNFFRMYEKISGMTGTAETENKEFMKIYNLDVVVIPTNRPVMRSDENDVIYLNEEYKKEAICDAIEESHKKGQPVLVGTISVEKSEELSKSLKRRHIPHEILNAKNHHREALIIAEAGAKGAVTIATNMAGRGTDIKLGGSPETRARKRLGEEAEPEEFEQALQQEILKWENENREVLDTGGLAVIGTERHESRRIDNQLRGRSGRQGDPGLSKFYISLDDDLMRLFGGGNFKQTMKRLGMSGDEPLYHPLINRALEKAQRRVEDRNYEIRKHLLEYDDVINKQRQHIYQLRDKILTDDNLEKIVLETGNEMAELLFEDYSSDLRQTGRDEAVGRLVERLKQNFFYNIEDEERLKTLSSGDPAVWEEEVREWLQYDIDEKREVVSKEKLNSYIRFEYIRQIDLKWQDHLENLEALREAVYLRSYAQKNPLTEYKKEGFEIFSGLIDDIRVSMARKLFKVRISTQPVERRQVAQVTPGQALHSELNRFAVNSRVPPKGSTSGGEAPIQIRRVAPKVGRNELCPCGSGKKYKNCCGK